MRLKDMSASIYDETVRKLVAGGVESPRLEARLLIADILKIDANEVNSSTALDEKLQAKLEQNISKRLEGMPIDKILGIKGFYKYDFIVSEDVLSPRPETEILLEEALQIIARNHFQNVLDLGTGSGCILLSLLRETPHLNGFGVDISSKALKIAIENAQKLDVVSRCHFLNKSWFDDDFTTKVNEKFDLIVSNPPYIQTNEIKTLDVAVQKFDPIVALDGGQDGLKDYRHIAHIAPKLLNKGGYILLEVGLGEAQDVKRIFENNSFKYIKTLPDLAGIERVVVFQN